MTGFSPPSAIGLSFSSPRTLKTLIATVLLALLCCPSLLLIANAVPTKALVASSALQPAISLPSKPVTSNDPLLDDGLLLENPPVTGSVSTTDSDTDALLTITPTKNGMPAYPSLLAIRHTNTGNPAIVAKTGAQLHRWIEDALNTAVALQLPLDITTVEEYRMTGETALRQSKNAFAQGKHSEGRYYADQGLQAYADALRLVMPSAAVEARAIWLDRKSIVNTGSPEGLRKLLRQLASTGINVVYFETVNAGYPIYPSQLVTQNPLIQGWDPLAVAVEEAHKQGMELHAWVWAFAVGNTRHNPLVDQPYDYPGPILSKLGNSMAMQMANGSIMPPRQTEYWLSPGNPEARTFLKTLFKEIVTQYAVDGVQLDYIRYPFQFGNGQAGYDYGSRKAYYKATGHPMPTTATPELLQWKTAQVSQFVKEVSTELKAAHPGLILSAAVFPLPRARRLQAIQQDWETWTANGWIDTLSPMIYTTSPQLFEASVASIVNATHGKTPIYPGVAAFRLDALQLVNHLQQAQGGGSSGVTLFANTHVDDEKQAMLKSGPYKRSSALQPHQATVSNVTPIVSQRILLMSRLLSAPSMVPTAQAQAVQTLLTQFQEHLESGQPASPQTIAAIQQQLQPWLTNGQRPYQAALLAQWNQDIRRANRFLRPNSSIQVASTALAGVAEESKPSAANATPDKNCPRESKLSAAKGAC